MLGALVSRVISLGLGTLYPAYASYKAVRTKNVKEYVKWMMYWIVFALFTSAELFADFFLSFWFPFYYELKIMFLLYLLLPATKGSSLLYRKFVHPALLSREQKIDELIEAAQTRSYDTAVQLGHRSFRYVTGLIMDQAVRAPAIMQEIIIGAGAGAGNTGAAPSGQRFRSGTITEIDTQDGNTRVAVATNIELSEDEVMEGVEINDEDRIEDQPANDVSGDTTSNSRSSKVTRRKKKSAVDLTFSSGGESDEGELDLSPSTRQAKSGKTVSRKAPARTASTRTRKPRQQN